MKINIDKLELNNKSEGVGRVNDIMKNIVNGSNLLPKPITYKDIDTSLTEFVSKDINILFGESEIKTFFFAQQRMNEFTKTWEMVDENKNILPNFKIVTRENNPNPGELQGGLFNIPGEPYFDISTFNKWDGNKNITVTCKMKQPYCVDLIYNVKFITNRLNLLNEMNNKFIDTFKSRQSYITVNGHYMPVTLESVDDEGDYDLNERKIFIQNFQLKVMGYIINENDIVFEENIVRALVDVNVELSNKPSFSNSNGNLLVNFPRKSKTVVSIKSDDDYNIVGINLEDSNILSYVIKINGSLVSDLFSIEKYDIINIVIQRDNKNTQSTLKLKIG